MDHDFLGGPNEGVAHFYVQGLTELKSDRILEDPFSAR